MYRQARWSVHCGDRSNCTNLKFFGDIQIQLKNSGELNVKNGRHFDVQFFWTHGDFDQLIDRDQRLNLS